MITPRCALCPATAGAPFAAGWTTRTLAQPVTFKTVFDGSTSVTPPGDYHLCATCSTWLGSPNRWETTLPAGILDHAEAQLADVGELSPTTYRRARAEMIGWVRHVTDKMGPPRSVMP